MNRRETAAAAEALWDRWPEPPWLLSAIYAGMIALCVTHVFTHRVATLFRMFYLGVCFGPMLMNVLLDFAMHRLREKLQVGLAALDRAEGAEGE